MTIERSELLGKHNDAEITMFKILEYKFLLAFNNLG